MWFSLGCTEGVQNRVWFFGHIIFYSICLKKSMILRGSNKRNLTIQKLLKAIENYVKTMLKWFLSQYAAFFIASGRTLGKDKYLYPLNYGNL